MPLAEAEGRRENKICQGSILSLVQILLFFFRYVNVWHSKNLHVRTYFFGTWQNRFLYFGVLKWKISEVLKSLGSYMQIFTLIYDYEK